MDERRPRLLLVITHIEASGDNNAGWVSQHEKTCGTTKSRTAPTSCLTLLLGWDSRWHIVRAHLTLIRRRCICSGNVVSWCRRARRCGGSDAVDFFFAAQLLMLVHSKYMKNEPSDHRSCASYLILLNLPHQMHVDIIDGIPNRSVANSILQKPSPEFTLHITCSPLQPLKQHKRPIPVSA